MSQLTEGIFAHAVSLHQGGRLRSTIYAYGKVVYILNMDKTVLLRFELPVAEGFENPVSFVANDYDASDFYEEDGQIVFRQSGGGFERKKSCQTPGKTFDQVDEMFKGFSFKDHKNEFLVTKDALNLLEEGLSHMEISVEGGALSIIQRDIYSGSIIELTREDEEGLLGGGAVDNLKGDFGPVGIRTNDFMALFSFCDSITVKCPTKSSFDYFQVNGPFFNMTGVVAACLYDEISTVKKMGSKVEKKGKEEEQRRRRG